MGGQPDRRVPLSQRASWWDRRVPASTLDGALAAGLVALVASTFAPWGRSGTVRRSSHQLVRSAERLEVLGPTAERVATVGWALLPFVAALALLALARHRRSAAAWTALVLSVGVGAVAAAFATQLPGADWGPLASLLCSLTLAAIATTVITTARRSSNHERT